MKKLPLILIILGLTGTAFWYCTRNTSSDDYRIVTLSGGESYFPFSNPLIQVADNADGYSALPLFDNDLIVIKIDSVDMAYRYSKRDGNSLKFRMEGFKLFLNERLISVKLSEDPALRDWLNALTPKETAYLQNVVIPDTLSRNYLDGLKKLARLKPDLGILFNNGNQQSVINEEILVMFKPVWLVFYGKLSESGLEKLYSLADLELLDIDNQNLDMERLLQLQSLTTLKIGQLESPRDGKKLVLPDNLTSLTLAQPEIENLDFLSNARRLKELNLVMCDSIRDISALAGLPNLSRIGFTASNVQSDLTGLSKIPITRFSFPTAITSQDFAGFIKSHKKLKTVELFGCVFITALEPLRDLPELSCLTVFSDSISTEKLFGFKNLDYLSVMASLPGDSAQLKELKQKLPNTIIVPSKGLCLGTGWLLLFIPLFILILAVISSFRKKIRV